MSMQVVWDDPDRTAIRLTFSPEWTWRELKEGFVCANAMIEAEAGRVVDLIFDAHQSAVLPDGTLTHVRELLSHVHPRTGLIVVIEGPNAQIARFGRLLVAFLQRFFWLHHPIFYTASLDEARAALKRRDNPARTS